MGLLTERTQSDKAVRRKGKTRRCIRKVLNAFLSKDNISRTLTRAVDISLKINMTKTQYWHMTDSRMRNTDPQ